MELNLYISAPGEQGAVSESIESGSPITLVRLPNCHECQLGAHCTAHCTAQYP